jgi:exopolysaccharide production protein ExoZ
MTIVSLQYLRALAAMMVVALHAVDKLRILNRGEETLTFSVGLAGVDIFFVISGFIIFVTAERSDASTLGFLRKRVIRIVPLYWVLTLLMAAVALARPDLLSTSTFDPSHFLASLLFVPWPHPQIPAMLPLLIPGWTLNYEMAFYALFAASLLLPKWLRLSTLFVVLASLATLGLFLSPDGVAAFYTDQIILEFAAGLILAHLWLRGVRIPSAVAATTMLVGFVLISLGAPSTLPRLIGAGIPAVMIVAGAVWSDRAAARRPVSALVELGDASYSTYLCHGIVIAVIAKLWTIAGLGAVGVDGMAFLAVSLIACAAGGVVLHRIVERPLLRWLSGKADRRPRDRSAIANQPGQAGSNALVRF